MSVVILSAGVLLVAVVLIGVAWTTVAAGSGAGPVTGRIAGWLWSAARAVHRRRPSHTWLSVAGVAIVFAVLAVLAVWIVLVLASWSLVFSTTDGAIRNSQTNAPADLVDRVYFAGYTVFTLGNGGYVTGDGVWQLATVVATGTGLMLVTLSITYLVPVASAVALRRQLGSYIASLGDTPHAIVINGWNGSSLSALGQHLVELAPLIHTARQQHLAYPVLHYFHSQHTDLPGKRRFERRHRRAGLPMPPADCASCPRVHASQGDHEEPGYRCLPFRPAHDDQPSRTSSAPGAVGAVPSLSRRWAPASRTQGRGARLARRRRAGGR